MNRHGGMTWREHVDQMQIDHARERDEGPVKKLFDALQAENVRLRQREQEWDGYDQLHDRLTAQLERLQAENARLREVVEAAQDFDIEPTLSHRSVLRKALIALDEHAKVSNDREGRG